MLGRLLVYEHENQRTFFCPISTEVRTLKSSLDKYRSTFTSSFMLACGVGGQATRLGLLWRQATSVVSAADTRWWRHAIYTRVGGNNAGCLRVWPALLSRRREAPPHKVPNLLQPFSHKPRNNPRNKPVPVPVADPVV